MAQHPHRRPARKPVGVFIMEKNRQTEPEVLTGPTEVIFSTSIERIVNGRNTALVQIEALIQLIDDVSALTSTIGGGTAPEWAMRPGHRYDCWFTEKAETAMKAITRNIDRSILRDLMLKSGMLALMDAQARDEWYKNLEREPFWHKDNRQQSGQLQPLGLQFHLGMATQSACRPGTYADVAGWETDPRQS